MYAEWQRKPLPLLHKHTSLWSAPLSYET